jgi:hypothetical protein
MYGRIRSARKPLQETTLARGVLGPAA